MQLNKQLIKNTIKLGWPISLQNILVTLLSMIDVIMVSHLGETAVAAVGLGNRVIFVFMVIILGLGWGVGILSAQYFGARQTYKIRRSILIGCCYGILALIPIVLLSFHYSGEIIGLGSSDTEVIALGQSYLWIVTPSLFFVAIIMVFENSLRSMNLVKLPLWFSTISIILNIILNYWLINGGLGIPALGVEGAAWATTISRVFQAAILLYAIHHLKLAISIKKRDFKLLSRRKDWSKMIRLVLPMMFGFGLWSVGAFCYQLIFGRMGTQELAVISMLLPIEGMFLSLFFGIASACSINVGQHLGANKMEEAWQTAKLFSWLSPLIACLFGLIVMLSSKLLLTPYSDLNPNTLELAQQILVTMSLLAWLKVTNMTLALGVLRAGGDNKYLLMADITGMWVISLPLTWLCAFHWELSLIFVVIAAYSEEVTKGLFFVFRVKSKRWMRNLTQ